MAGGKDDIIRARMAQLGGAWQNPAHARAIGEMAHAVQSGDLVRAKKMAEQCHLSVQQLHDALFPEIQRIFDRLDHSQQKIVALVQQLHDQAMSTQVKIESVAESSKAMRSALETLKQYADLGAKTHKTPDGALCEVLSRGTHAQKATLESLRALTTDQIEMTGLVAQGGTDQPAGSRVEVTGPAVHAAAPESNTTCAKRLQQEVSRITQPDNPRGVRACLKLIEMYSARYKSHRPTDELDFIWAFIENQHILVARLVQKALLQRYPHSVRARTRSGSAHPATGVRPLIYMNTRLTWPRVERILRELKYTSVRAQLYREEKNEEDQKKSKQQQQ